jgi:Glyoxalase superfamily protein
MSIEFRTIPILLIFSVEKAEEFYIGWLGFKIDWEHPFEQITPEILASFPMPSRPTPGRAPRVRLPWISRLGRKCGGLDEFHREIVGKNYNYSRPGLEHTPWKANCCEVVDPFGHRIRFNEHAASRGSPS